MKKQNLRIAIAQINCTVGDLEGNSQKIRHYLDRAISFGVDMVVFPELTITGYPPEDLLLKAKFITHNIAALRKLAQSTDKDALIVVGFVDRKGCDLYNAAAAIYNGKIHGVYHKMLLPNYGVFDEKRYFTPGEKDIVFRWGNSLFAINICEDIWHKEGPARKQVLAGARLILNINASPYHVDKIREREKILRAEARINHIPIVYANLVGGQDELVFDGQSMVVDNNGELIARAEAFKEDLLITDLDIPLNKPKYPKKIITITGRQPDKCKASLLKRKNPPLETIAEIYQALILGLHDYVFKNDFQNVVIGLSGGIDSSLTASLAADALGQDNVIGVFMPSRYTSRESEEDAKQLAVNLGIKLMCISIESIYKMYLAVLEPHFVGSGRDITEENLQARIRGNILMALSNKFGWLVLTTGNKSEMSAGYVTLYGDMAGGFAVIKDVPKTLIYKLVGYRNAQEPVIPERVLSKAPTAELKPQQKDSDTLPIYRKLDPILEAYVEKDKDLASIVSAGFDKQTVQKVLNMVDKSEYKRRQSPPGIKITPKAFGRDRRMPITNKYRG